MRQTLKVLSFVSISIGKHFFPPPMFEEVFKTTLILLSIVRLMNSFSLHYPFLPLSHIVVSFWGRPHADSVSFPSQPLSFVVFSIDPREGTFAFFFIIPEPSYVNSIFCELVAFESFTVHPVPLEEISFPDLNSKALPFSFHSYPKVNAILSDIDSKVFLFNEFDHTYFFIFGEISLNEGRHFFLLRHPNDLAFIFRLHYAGLCMNFPYFVFD